MKIFITGAAGFFGSNLSEYLLNKGHTVVAVDNFNDFYNPKVKEYNIKEFKDNPKFNLYRDDIVDQIALEKIFAEHSDINAIVHLAAWAGVTRSFKEPSIYARNNVEGTASLALLAIKYNIKNIIFASTSSLYGNNPTPFKEEMKTDTPLSPYPATKKACEVLLYSYTENYDLNTTILRIFNPIGPRLRPDLLLPKLIKSALYDIPCPIYWTKEDMYTKTGRDYTYINHMFELIEKVIVTPLKYEILNLGNSSPVMLGDVIDIVEKIIGKKPNLKLEDYRMGEMLVTYADISKAKELLGYNPVTTMEESVKIFYDWFIKQEEWYKQLVQV